MLHKFPREHVTNLGGGTIGPIYITRTQDGKALFAEAELFRAPFKHMIIDSPALLDMFQNPMRHVNLDVLNHPWPQFHLAPREEMDFDVARLERLEYVRSGNKMGHMVKGHPYVSTVEVTPPVQAGQEARKRSQPNVAAEVQGTRHSERMSSKKSRPSLDSNQGGMRLPVIAPTSPSPGVPVGYTIATRLDDAQAETVRDQMSDLKEEMFELLSAEDRQTYEWVLTTGLKRQGKEGAKFRVKVIERLQDLMRAQGDRAKELQRLHNQYAQLQRQLEKRWPYHLPHIDKLTA